MSQKVVLITGCTQGYGLALARESLQRGDVTYAGKRSVENTDELMALASEYPELCHVVELDVTNDENMAQVAEMLEKEHGKLDILINNACLWGGVAKLDTVTTELMTNVFAVNATAPVMMIKALRDLLIKSGEAKVVNVSSTWGSIWFKSDNKNGANAGHIPYCASKAALNMATRAIAFELQPDNVTVVSLHPGGRGDAGGGPKTRGESAESIFALIDSIAIKDTAKFFTWQGFEFPW